MITISLCMIVKNEEAVLPRILEQMKKIADEIIIVDTGSTDNTRALASAYNCQIFDFIWQDDFSAARNFAISKASMDYWMWLDADDVITDANQEKLLNLKAHLDPNTDMVMMKYATGFNAQGQSIFSYYRERLLKNGRGFLWEGKVHESVTPRGNIIHVPIEIEHRKLSVSDPDRNLNIYRGMLARGEYLEPRHQFYYGRELYTHGQYAQAAAILSHFLEDPSGWKENKIEACLQLSDCYNRLGFFEQGRKILFSSFLYDTPRAEICCEIGRLLLADQRYGEAAHWYEQALACQPDETSGAFIQSDCYDFLPCIQLCVCYDRLGDYTKAYEYHCRSRALRPDAEAVCMNQKYFQKLGFSED